MKILATFFTGLCLLLTPVVAWADLDTPPTTTGDRADVLMREGIALGKEGKWADARKKLEEAWALKKSYDIAGNLAHVEDEMGEHAAAATHYDYAIRTFPATGKQEHKATLIEEFEKIRAKVGRLQIAISVDGATILVDDVEVGLSPAETLFVKPGTRILAARKEGYRTVSKTATVEAGQTLVFSLELEKSSGGGTQPLPAEGKPVWPTALLASLGIASLATGVGLTIGASVEHGNSEELSGCQPFTDACRADAQAVLDQADLLQNAGFVMYGLAAASATAMVVYLALPNDQASSTAITPAVSPSFSGVFITQHF